MQRATPGATNTFALTLPFLGDVKRIRVGHDNTGFFSSWYLDRVVVSLKGSQKHHLFVANCWVEVVCSIQLAT